VRPNAPYERAGLVGVRKFFPGDPSACDPFLVSGSRDRVQMRAIMPVPAQTYVSAARPRRTAPERTAARPRPIGCMRGLGCGYRRSHGSSGSTMAASSPLPPPGGAEGSRSHFRSGSRRGEVGGEGGGSPRFGSGDFICNGIIRSPLGHRSGLRVVL
jgi:hypothetical protein